MAPTPRSTIEDSFASNLRCTICGAQALHVGHVSNLPDYVSCRECGSAFLVEEGGERVFYGQIAPGFPDAETFALRQWAFPEAVEKVARPERPTLPEILPEPTPETPAPSEPPSPAVEAAVEAPPADADEPGPADQLEQAPKPESEPTDSTFASEFGFLEELAKDGPSSEPPAGAPTGLVDGDEPHAADALTPPPWARVEPSEDPGPAPIEEGAPAGWTAEVDAPAAEAPIPDEPVPPSPEPGALPVWETFEEPSSPAEPIAQPTPAPEADVPTPDEADSFTFEDDEIPGEPIELGGMDDPLGLASAFESLSLDSTGPDALGEEGETGEADEPAEDEPEHDWLAGLREVQPEQDATSPEPDLASADLEGAGEVRAEDDWPSGMTALPQDDGPATIESRGSAAAVPTAADDLGGGDDWLTSMAAGPDEDDPTTIESSGARAMEPEQAGDDVDWLSAMADAPLEDANEELDLAPEAPDPAPGADWLSEIEQEGDQPKPDETPHPAGEPSADEDWLDALSEATGEADETPQAEVDWLASIGDTAAGGDEPMHTVINWLSSREAASDSEPKAYDEPDSGIDWLGEHSDGEDAEEAPQDAGMARDTEPEPPAMEIPDDEEEDEAYDPFDLNQRIASLKADARREETPEAEEDDFLSGLRRSAAIPLDSEPLDDTPLASVNLESKPFIETGLGSDEPEDDADPLAMAARMGAISAAADEAGLPEWMEDSGEEQEAGPAQGAFKLRATDPPLGQRHRVVLRGDRVVFPSGDCAHCGRTPVKGRLAVYGTLPNGQKVGQRKVTSFNVPLCAECRTRAAQLTEDASNARLQAHLISAIVGMVLALLALALGLVDPGALTLPDVMILAILLLVGYAGPATFLLNRVGNYAPPPDAIYVRTTLIVPSETQGLETAFEWRNAEYAQRFYDANQSVALGKLTSVKDRLASPES
jgi:hypothetical protein